MKYNSSLQTKLLVLILFCISTIIGFTGFVLKVITEKKVAELPQQTEALIQLMDELSDFKVVLNNQRLEWKNSLIFVKNNEQLQEHYEKFVKLGNSLIAQSENLKQKLPNDVKSTLTEFDQNEKDILIQAETSKTKYLMKEPFLIEEADDSLKEFFQNLSSNVNKIGDKLAETSMTAQQQGLKNIQNIILYTLAGLICFGFCFLVLSRFLIVNLSKKLKHSANSVQQVIERTQVQSQMLVTASQSLSDSAKEQVNSIVKSASSLQQISSMVQRTNSNIKVCLVSGNEAIQFAEQGREIIDQMTKAMEDISQSNRQLEEISNMMSNINDKTSMINDIVFKTQLLSFNASIEAARAGEHGRGFSVVAAEINNLSLSSGSAANEITTLIEASQERTKNSLITIQEKIKQASTISENARKSFYNIVTQIENVNIQIKSMEDASQQQEQGLYVVNNGIREIEKAATDTNKASHNTFESSKSLIHENKLLRETAVELNLIVIGEPKNKDKSEEKSEKKTA